MHNGPEKLILAFWEANNTVTRSTRYNKSSET